MKNNNDAIDIAKFIFSILIMQLHCIDSLCLYDTNIVVWGIFQTSLRLAVPFFFICSSYFFWKKIKRNASNAQAVGKIIFFWIIQYVFWSIIHLCFYKFDWYFPTAGVLWFFYALILGSLLSYVIVRICRYNIYIIFILISIISLFMSFGDAWYGYSQTIPVLSQIVNEYYVVMHSMRTCFTYGVLYSLLGYILSCSAIEKFFKQINCRILLIGFILCYILLVVETRYVYSTGSFKEFGHFFLTVPTITILFTILLKSTYINANASYFRKL